MKKPLHSQGFMRMAGLEPARSHLRKILSLVRLPIPPHPHLSFSEVLLKPKIMLAQKEEECKLFLENNYTFLLQQ